MIIKVNLEPAWILHRHPWRESSLLVEAFTRDHGRVALVSKGARSAKSSRRGLLEPFRPLLLSWTQRGEMATLTGAESGEAPAALIGEALWCGFYCNELLMRLLPRQDPAPELWVVYSDTLDGLADQRRRPGCLRRFELAVLEELGAVSDLATEAGTGQPVAADQYYRLNPESGPVAAGPDASGAVSGESLLALAAKNFGDADAMHTARAVTRQLLDRQLDGRPLKSRQMFL